MVENQHMIKIAFPSPQKKKKSIHVLDESVQLGA